ncbi:MAG: hypothetical protein QW739_01430 [Candidatus Odinarchaeota archaeon]
MTCLFFYLSGEHQTLPVAECIAILEGEKIKYSVIMKAAQIIVLDTEEKAARIVAEKAAYTHMVCKLIGVYDSRMTDFKSEDLSGLKLSGGETFSVRVYVIGEDSGEHNKLELERIIGGKVIAASKGGLKVQLQSPCTEFIGIVSGGKLFFDFRLSKIDRRAIDKRSGKYRPYFYPGVINPRIARAMVNLARVRCGDVFLEPFIGTGGIGIEAGVQGCRVIGLEIKRKMIYASKSNLNYYKVRYDLVIGDARSIPFTKADGGATDPPYGVSTSTLGDETWRLIKETLKNIQNIIKPGGYFTIAFPAKINLERLVEGLKLKVVDVFELYVHKSLTRKIVVLRR